ERLLEEVERAESDDAHRGLDRTVARDHDDRQLRRLLLHAAHQLDAVDLGHPDVDDRQPRHRLLEQVERHPPVGPLHPVEALARQPPAQRVPDLLPVIPPQNRLGHSPPLHVCSAPPYAPRRACTTSCAACRRTGNSRMKRLPRGTWSRTRMKPLWSATMLDTMASPSPVPSGLVEK